MVSWSTLLKAWELLPILLLLGLGGTIAIRSGVRGLATRHDLRMVMENLSRIVLRVLAYGGAMLLVQQWIGMRPGLGW